MKRLEPDYNPRRRKCPGCGSKERPIKSLLKARDLRRQKLLPLMCPRCARHVWVAPVKRKGRAQSAPSKALKSEPAPRKSA